MKWGLLVLLLTISGVVSLSAHVLILYSGIPFPSGFGHVGWAGFADRVVELFGMVLLYRLADHLFADKPWHVRCVLLFLLVTTLQERLLRAPIIDTFATTAFRYSVLRHSKALIGVMLASATIAAFDKHLRSRWHQGAVCLGLAAILAFLVAPVVNAEYAYLLDRFEYLDHPGLYSFPYPWQLNLPAYITFVEPTISAAIIYTLARDRLDPRPFVNLLEFALLVAAIRYALLDPLLYPLLTNKFAPAVAMASQGQFLLEALTLGITVAASCRYAIRNAASSPASMLHSNGTKS